MHLDYPRNARYSVISKTVKAMKLTGLFLTIAAVHVYAKVNAQITIHEKNKPLSQVIGQLQKQSGYSFLYKHKIIENKNVLSVELNNAALRQALEQVLAGQNLSFDIINKTVVIKQSVALQNSQPSSFYDTAAAVRQVSVRGHVTDSSGNPLIGVAVYIKKSNRGALTDKNGYFILSDINPDDATLVVSYIGYDDREIKLNGRQEVEIVLTVKEKSLEDVVVNKGYYTTSRRLNTGDVTTITADVIQQTATSDPILSLQGRVPGLLITPSDGSPGAAAAVQLRGPSSLYNTANGVASGPLFIVDGVPFPSTSLDQLTSIGYAASDIGYGYLQSPFKTLDPSSIESIEVLKDADATAIYGAQGANGVILIKTKKARAKKINIGVNASASFAKQAHFMDMLSLPQYLAMRREAFANDGITPTVDNAPDLLLWDTTKSTDWQRKYFGATAKTQDANLALSGSSSLFTYRISGGYRKETTIHAGDYGLTRGNGSANIGYTSKNKKLNITALFQYSSDKNIPVIARITDFYNLPPDYPLYNPDGSPYFFNSNYLNPEADFKQKMINKTKELYGNFHISYEPVKNLVFQVNTGYTHDKVGQQAYTPSSSLPPAYLGYGTAAVGYSKYHVFNLEPQVSYKKEIGKNHLTGLLGGTYKEQVQEGHTVFGYYFDNDTDLLNFDTSHAQYVYPFNFQNSYKYVSGYVRFGYDYDNKYVLNLTGRRDGSSKFGPGNQYGNFGSAGAAWVISQENFFKQTLGSFINFAKLRGSYGVVGSDNIPNYAYFVNYTQGYINYGGMPVYTPSNLFNPNFKWESTKKLEVALELGLLDDKINITADYYRNRTGNQLVGYSLPTQTGFASVTGNLNASVQNSGWEFSGNADIIRTKDIRWSVNGNISFNKNKLLDFPGLAASSYATTFQIGAPISIVGGYATTFNTQTGNIEGVDLDGDGTTLNYPGDYITYLKNLLPKYFGGFGTDLSYKNFTLNAFFTFKNQDNGELDFYFDYPGTMYNQPSVVLDRWQKQGDNTRFPKYTTSDAQDSWYAFYESDRGYFPNSYIRLSTLSLSYNFTGKWVKRTPFSTLQIYALGNNLFTATKFPGMDPDIPYGTPPLRSFTFGLRTNL